MIVARLFNRDPNDAAETPEKVFLAETPFPGDIIEVPSADTKCYRVISRRFIGLSKPWDSERSISVKLEVRNET